MSHHLRGEAAIAVSSTRIVAVCIQCDCFLSLQDALKRVPCVPDFVSTFVFISQHTRKPTAHRPKRDNSSNHTTLKQECKQITINNCLMCLPPIISANLCHHLRQTQRDERASYGSYGGERERGRRFSVLPGNEE